MLATDLSSQLFELVGCGDSPKPIGLRLCDSSGCEHVVEMAEHLGTPARTLVLLQAFPHRSSLRDTLSISQTRCCRYSSLVPKLWSQTIESHRHAVRDAILDATAAAVAEHGLASVTMLQIAENTGIGRATLYKYFPDVEAILIAWHERQIVTHLKYLGEVRDRAGGPIERLKAVLEAYAFGLHHHADTELGTLLHRGEQVTRARQQLRNFIRDLVSEGAQAGELRDDVAPDELASYCLHALTAAGSLPSKAAVHRLVRVTLAGLRPAA